MQPVLSATRAPALALPYLPAPQLSHWPCAGLDWCFPAGHGLQSLVLVDPSPGAYRPAEQSMHADAPLLDWYVPARQEMHLFSLSEPVAATYLPWPH